MVWYGNDLPEEKLPHAAVRPYPSQYVSHVALKDGSEAVIRPIRSEDERLMVALHQSLSESSVRRCYFHLEKLDTRVARKCFIDYDREMALVADRKA